MKNKNRIVLICAIALVMTIAVGATLAYFYGEHNVTNRFSTASSDKLPTAIITEPNWPTPTSSNDPGPEPFPGDVIPKDPTIVNKGGEAYGRIVIKLYERADDGTRTAMTDTTKINTIMTMLVNDKPAKNKYSWAELSAAGFNHVNTTDFTLDTTKGIANEFYYNINNKLTGNDSYTLFHYVAFPYDFTKEDMAKLGKFDIDVTAQVIQAQGFANMAEAIAAMDAQLATATPTP